MYSVVVAPGAELALQLVPPIPKVVLCVLTLLTPEPTFAVVRLPAVIFPTTVGATVVGPLVAGCQVALAVCPKLFWTNAMNNININSDVVFLK